MAHALAAQDDELLHRRREEIVTLRRAAGELALRFEELQRGYGALVELVHDERRRRDPRLRSHVIKYNADQPRVPAGEHGGGQWTSDGGGASTNDAGKAPAAAAPPGSQRGPQYAQAGAATQTDATDGGTVSAADAQQNPKGFFHDLPTVITALIRDTIVRDRHNIWSNQIPDDSPNHAEPLCDSFGQPILDDKGNPLVRPADLPPEAYVQAGLAAKSRYLPDIMHVLGQAIRGEYSDQFSEDVVNAAANMVAYELLPFAHAGSFDAERFDNVYVRDYRHYTSIALGIFMAAAGVSKEDMLTIADDYASAFSTFRDKPDQRYKHSSAQDVQDNLRGYELYESGRIRLKN